MSEEPAGDMLILGRIVGRSVRPLLEDLSVTLDTSPPTMGFEGCEVSPAPPFVGTPIVVLVVPFNMSLAGDMLGITVGGLLTVDEG